MEISQLFNNQNLYNSIMIYALRKKYSTLKIYNSFCFILGFSIIILASTQILDIRNVDGVETNQETITLSNISYSKQNNLDFLQDNPNNDNYIVLLSEQANNSFYAGIITFTSNQSVNLLIHHDIDLKKYKIQQNMHDDVVFSDGTNQKLVTTINPQYNINQDMFSSSIPFAGKSLILTDDDPFFVLYTINANEVKQDHNSINKTTYEDESVAPFAPPSTYIGPQLILAEVLRVLDNNLLEQLPLEQLSINDLTEIVKKLPTEKAQIIINKLSKEQKQKLAESLPENKLDVIGVQ